MLGGITPVVRPVPDIRLIPPEEPKVAIGRERIPLPRAVPPVMVDIPPVIGDKLNDVRYEPIVIVGRDRKAIGEPPPVRPGMNPSNIPPYGMIMEPPPLPLPTPDIA